MKPKPDNGVEKFATSVQKMLDGNTALLIGSGGSIPYGLPSMQGLAEEIVSNLEAKYHDESNWQTFVAELQRSGNLETAMENCVLHGDIYHSIIITVWSLIINKERDAFFKFIRNGQYPALTMILKKFLQRAGETNIITTNYDRLVEYSVDFAQGIIETGFHGNYFKSFRSASPSGGNRKVNLFKVHGSIDWFKDKRTEQIVAIQFHDPVDWQDTYLPMIVTPGNGKYRETHNDPFRTVIAQADRALRSASSFLCIGYGFNDEHIQPILINENRNKNKPIVIVTKEITPKIQELFFESQNSKCLLITERIGGGTDVYYNKSERESFQDNYWHLDSFYKLWFE